MSNDIYKAPEADLTSNTPNKLSSEFFVVSIHKLWIMNMITMGSYVIVWNYLNWKNHKEHLNIHDIWPIPRTIFSIFFIYSLTNLISDSYQEKTNKKWNPVLFAVAYIVLALLGYALSFISEEASLLILLSTILTSLLGTLVLSSIQKKANEACDDINGKKNSRITGWNIFWIVICSLLWLSLVVNAFIVV